jgi:adenosylcobinamide-phosphate synthase
MGRAIERLEAVIRPLSMPLVTSGGIFALVLILAAWLSGGLLVAGAYRLHPLAGPAVEVIVVFYCISARSLAEAAMDVWRHLKPGRVDQARASVAMIVGRETKNLDPPAIARAAVETVAENLVDGFVAPLFFAALGGAPLALAYRMVNTLDSMVGYKNERYVQFGRVAARIDDAANFIPARISVPIIAAAAQILCQRGRPAWTTGYGQGRRHASPNSGFSEAAFAGALAVKLGGPNVYHGKLVEKPYIGGQFGAVGLRHIPRACDLMLLSALIWTAAAAVSRMMVVCLW